MQRFGNLVEASDGGAAPSVDDVVHGLSREAQPSGQFGVTHIFFCMAQRRLSCEGMAFFFIVPVIGVKFFGCKGTAKNGTDGLPEAEKTIHFCVKCIVLHELSFSLMRHCRPNFIIFATDMEERYSRNRLYLSEEDQERIKHFRILLGGAGIGSVIAECALRFGFESITVVDGDRVELSNLNRQNYQYDDIGKYKAECLARRLKKINPSADVRFIADFIDSDNVAGMISDCDIAVNALDFKSDIPFLFDRLCAEKGLHVLHPYNLGWAGLVTVIDPFGRQVSTLSDGEYCGFELKMAGYVRDSLVSVAKGQDWLDGIITQYQKEAAVLPPPQLSVASWIVAGLCVDVMFRIATERPVKYFPEFYLSSLSFDGVAPLK